MTKLVGLADTLISLGRSANSMHYCFASMTEIDMHSNMEQHIIVTFLTKENMKTPEICKKLRRQFCEESLQT